MIPETIGALLAFLGLVAPGLVYQLLRERSRASVAETAFREASRVALVSLVLTLATFGVLAVARLIKPTWIADPGRWLRQGNSYFVDNYGLVVRTGVIAITIACLFALAADWIVRQLAPGQGKVSKTSVWFKVLRTDRPKNKVPWIHVHLKSGVDYWGFVGYYSAEMSQLDRELSVTGPDLQYRAMVGGEKRNLDNNWKAVVIPAHEIEYMRVQYLPKKGSR